jgi:hypothetical protein
MIGSGNVLFEVNAAVRKLAELSSLLDLCSAGIQSAAAISMSCPFHPCSKVLPRQRVDSIIPIT